MAEGEAAFGTLLAGYRRAAGLTQEALAERAGLSVRGISDLERGQRTTPQAHTVRVLAAALRLGAPERAALEAAARGAAAVAPSGGRHGGSPVAPSLLVSQDLFPALPEEAHGNTGHRAGPPLPREREQGAWQRLQEDVWRRWNRERVNPHDLLPLTLVEEPGAVAYPGAGRGAHRPPARPLLAPDTRIATVFEVLGGELLILGASGAGKTALLHELTGVLLNDAPRDAARPLPVIVDLETWGARRDPLAGWLVDQLHVEYGVPPECGRVWVGDGRLLPLLDGLERVEVAARAACVEAINAFWRDGPGRGQLVVCCQAAAYEALPIQLQLRGAVHIQSLSPAQVDAAVARGADRYQALQEALQAVQLQGGNDRKPDLLALMTTPLLLDVIGRFAREKGAGALADADWRQGYHPGLMAAYIAELVRRRPVCQHYTRDETARWLTWLAEQLGQQGQQTPAVKPLLPGQVFYAEDLQPTWLTHGQRRVYAVVDRIGGGLVVAAVVGPTSGLVTGLIVERLGNQAVAWVAGQANGLLVGLLVGLFVGLFGGDARGAGEWRPERWRGALRGCGVGLLLGVGVGLVTARGVGPVAGLVAGPFGGLVGLLLGALVGAPGLAARRVVLVPAVRWSLAAARATWRGAATVGAIVGLVVGLLGGLGLDPDRGLVLGVGGGLLGGLGVVLLGGIEPAEQVTRQQPNQGIWQTWHRAQLIGLLAGILAGLAGALVFGVAVGAGLGLASGLGLGLVFALVGWLVAGGYACLSHLALRLVLWHGGAMPLRYARFLDDAAARTLLIPSGGGYRFWHD